MTRTGDRVSLPPTLKVAGGLCVLVTTIVALLVLGALGLMGAALVGAADLIAILVVLGGLSLPVWPTIALTSATRRSRAGKASRWLWPLFAISGALALAGLNWIVTGADDLGCNMLFCDLAFYVGLFAVGTAAVMGGLGVWMLRELTRLGR